MKLSQFRLKIPNEQIALYPAQNRDESRLLVLHTKTGAIEHRMFKEIIDYFEDKDVLVLNDTKVFPARLYGNKEKTGAKIEVFLLRELNRGNGCGMCLLILLEKLELAINFILVIMTN